MYFFRSECEYLVRNKKVFGVQNPIRCHDFKHLIGEEVVIDDVHYIVLGVECFAHAPTWVKDEKISLMVDEITF